MANVGRSIDFGGNFLQAVKDKGFESYYRGFEGAWLSIIGIGTLFHSWDPSNHPPEHLSEWLNAMASVLEAFTRLKYKPSAVNDVGSTVTALLHQRLSSGDQAEALTRGRPPNRANTELFEALAWALGICVVWFEEIEGEMVTRVYRRSEGHQWLFYAYFGFDGKKVYCFEHPTLKNHEAGSPSCYQTHEQPRPIIVGTWIGEPSPQPQEQIPDDFEIGFLRLLIDNAARIDPAAVPESTHTYMQELIQQWNHMLERPETMPLFSAIGFDLVTRALKAGARESAAPIAISTTDSHPLRDCPSFPNHNSNYIQHINHFVHEDCLRAFLQQKLSANPQNSIKCEVCPSLYHESLVKQVLPHFQTLKEEALKRQQDAVTRFI